MTRTSVVGTVLLGVAVAGCASNTWDIPIECEYCKSWNEAQAPFAIYANTYYVGTAGLSSILVDAGDGLALFDGGLPQSAPQIVDNLRTLGFDVADVNVIFVSHVHYDHVGGIAALQRLSGARVIVGAAGRTPLASGVLDESDPQYDTDRAETRFPAVKNVEAAADGATIRIANIEITAVATPGHTANSTSWTWRDCDSDGRCADIVYADSLSAVSRDGFRFTDGAVDALRASGGKIAQLDCDILLSPHPFNFDMHDKLATGEPDAFIDGGDCERYAANALERLERRLERKQRQQASIRPDSETGQ